jgi:hypothetical protein
MLAAGDFLPNAPAIAAFGDNALHRDRRSPPPMLAVLLCLCALPQGPTAVAGLAPRADFGYPQQPGADLGELLFAPFVDGQGQGIAAAPRAGGIADLDGDGNRDVWFVAGPGAGSRDGDLAILSAQTADLGRFVEYGEIPGRGFRGAASFRRAGVADAIVAVDRHSIVPWLVFHQPGYPDPRQGSFVVQPTIWPVGPGLRAVEALDPDGDGHDDLLLLRDLGPAAAPTGAVVTRLHFGFGAGGHQLLHTAEVALPFAADRLRAADLDGDGATDAVLHLPGLGVVALRIDPLGRSTLHSVLELGPGLLEDLEVGDLGADGRDDWIATLADGCVICRSDPGRVRLDAVARPASLGPLAGSRLVTADEDRFLDLVAHPRTGGQLAVFRFDPLGDRLGAAALRMPPSGQPELALGAGIAGLGALRGDVDGDGDEDLLLQTPAGARWLCLRGIGAPDLSPLQVQVATVGAPSAAGFVEQRFTIDLPAALWTAGFTELEFAIHVLDPQTGEPVYWEREIIRPDPQLRRVTLAVQAMLDPLFADWLWQNGIRRHPQTGEPTAFGPTVLTVHGKRGPQRTASRLLRWDGEGDPNGSAVGVRWRLVTAPPLPKSDAQLLPWD